MYDEMANRRTTQGISREDVMRDAVKIRLSGYDPEWLQIMASVIHDALKGSGERVFDWSESRPSKELPGVYYVHLTARRKDQ